MRKVTVLVAVTALAAACSSGGGSKTSSTTTKSRASGSARTTDLKLDPGKNYGNKYANGILPVGDNKYVTDAPKKGSVYLCQAPQGGAGGAQERGPWFLDNGPLAPGGFGVELPTVFAADDRIDPVGADIYTTKALKYPWAPDTYLAFPAVYFHYQKDGPPTRRILGEPERGRGSGVVESQIAVSRDGLDWTRYPRPAYVPIGGDGTNREHMLFVTQGMVRRGNEIWQYVGGHGGSGTAYHSPYAKEKPAPLYRYVQRLDGFVAAEASYTGGTFTTKPFRFEGTLLKLNIDTGATGYAQVGFLDEKGSPIPGYSVDDCVYINGDFIDTSVEWLKHGSDISALAGKPVQLVFRMRGTKLFAMQFTKDRS